MSAIIDFYEEWRQDSNPWLECYREGKGVFEIQFAYYSVGFILLYLLGNYIKKIHQAAVEKAANDENAPFPNPRSLTALIASRPTVLAGSIHSIATAVIAVGILIFRHLAGNSWDYRGIDLIKVWQTVGLPISISYFIMDCFFYCLPRKDLIIFVHHVIMCFCHYPVGHDSGSTILGLGDKEWITWLSIMGYTSEVSTAFMNYRWYLLNSLEENWIGFGVVNVLVVAGFGGRVVMFSYLLMWEIFPRAHMYIDQRQLFTYAMMVFGHVGIGMLSLYWCIVMCKGGLKSLFVFKKKTQSTTLRQGFSFADVARGDDAPKRNGERGVASKKKK